MEKKRITRSWLIGALTPFYWTHAGLAQVAPPPPPPPAAAPLPPPPAAAPPAAAPPAAAPPAAAPPAAAPPAAAPPAAAPPAAGAAAPAAEVNPAVEGATSAEQTTPTNGASGAAAEPNSAALAAERALEENKKARAARARAARNQPSLRGSTGLMRTHAAGSGSPGTFRMGLLSSYFSSSQFLCPQCADEDGGPGSTPDEVSRIGAHLQLGVTPWEFLEVYVGVHSFATQNSRGNPSLLQVLADSTWGIKGFTPAGPDDIFQAGAAAELWLLNGAGEVGIDSSSYALRALGSMDLSNRSKEADQIPLRVHLNLSYIFDNSGTLIEEAENENLQRISRIERYGLNINRIDRLVPALGVEGMFDDIRPYVEWSVDIPAAFDTYSCLRSDVQASDVCLDDHESFAATPSRLTLGARGFVLVDGLALHAALDLGTGGTTPPFWEETQPETPWNIHFGASYVADNEPVVELQRVEIPIESAPVIRPKPRYLLEGTVVEQGAPATTVPGAIIRYQGRDITGMVANEQGLFRSASLEPGSYTFSIEAEHYEPGTCDVIIEAVQDEEASASITGTAATDLPTPSSAQDPTALQAPGVEDTTDAQATERAQPDPNAPLDRVTQAQCELKAEPRVGTIDGYLLAGLSNDPVPFAKVHATNEAGASISLDTDEQGAFAFTNVPPGKIHLRIEAEGYYQGSSLAVVEAYKTVQAQVPLFKKSRRAQVRKTGQALRLKKAIEFREGSAEFTPESLAMLDALASWLRDNPKAGKLEIISHTTGSVSPLLSQQLSEQRSAAIRDMLVINGIAADRLTAVGVGDTKSKGPKAKSRIELKLAR